MTTALTILLTAILVAILGVAAVAPNRARHSAFERKRRREQGENTRLEDLRERRFADVESLRRSLLAVLLVLFTLCAIGVMGWLGGGVSALIVALAYGPMARLGLVQRFAQQLYDEQEAVLLGFVQRHAGVFKWFRHDIVSGAPTSFASKAELEHMIQANKTVLSDEEKSRLIGGLRFEGKLVRDVMTPRRKMFTVKNTDILGPLVLDDLHKSGHGSFPVIGTTIDEVVGVLRLRDVQTLDTTRKHTAKVETAMDPNVSFVTADEPLAAALTTLLGSQHHVMIVVDKDDRSVVGLITLKDIIQTLFGQAS